MVEVVTGSRAGSRQEDHGVGRVLVLLAGEAAETAAPAPEPQESAVHS